MSLNSPAEPALGSKNLRPARSEETAKGLKQPLSILAPAIELSEWGGRLPGQSYFPVPLANGRDAMMINISGSGEAHWERHMRSSNPLSRLLNTEWYKADRRDHSSSELVYGQLMPFVDFSSGPMMRGEEVVPRDVKQYFDPRSATITTFISQRDNRTEELLEIRSQTFLTHDGLLMQIVHCTAAPEDGLQYFFSMGEPSPNYQNAGVPLVKPDDAAFDPEDSNPGLMRYSSRWEQGRAAGFSLVGGVRVEKIREIRKQRPEFLQKDQITARFFAGDMIWRAVTVQDDREGGDPRAACAKLLERIEREGVEGLHAAHCARWEEYFSSCSVNLPDDAAQFLYDVSRYIIKANLHPSGFLPMGTMPYLWQGAMFWDASFGHQALLGCGNFGDAKSITGHLRKLEPHGRTLAEKLGSPGTRIEWTVNLFDYSTYDPPCLQIHNNAVWAHAIQLESSIMGCDADDASIHFVRDLLVFLVDQLLNHSGDDQAGSIIGIDESVSDPKPNDTWSLAICLRALDDYASICAARGEDPGIPEINRARERIRELLAGNTDERGILQSFTGGRVPHWGSIVFDLFPDAPQALPTLVKMSENYNPEYDLFNFHGINRYAERAFPWANNWVARCLGRMRRSEALHYWLNNTRSTNSFGGVPERVYYHGENYINWCMTGHAAQVWAMNGMLADFRDSTLTLLGGIDPEVWSDLSFDGLHTEGGFSVCLHLEAGKISVLCVTSLRPEPRDIRLQAPHFGLDTEVRLTPGRNTIISG